MLGKSIKANELKEKIENNPKLKQHIIDVRNKSEIKDDFKILATKNVEANELMRNPSSYIKRNQTYYFICDNGLRSKLATITLRVKKYDVINVKGGLKSYFK